MWDEPTIRHHATALAERSLLDGSGGRYSEHQIVRSYAHRLLSDPADYHRAAAAYFRQQYASSHPDAHSHPARNLADVQPLLDAFDQLCAAGDYQDAADLLMGTYFEYLSGGGGVNLYGLLRRWSEFSRLMAMSQRLVNAPTDKLRSGSRANSFMGLGLMHKSMGEYDKAIEYYAQCLPIMRQLGDRQGEAAALGNLGNAYQSLGEYDKAIEHHNNALKIDREIGSLQGQAEDLGNLGIAYQSLGEYDKAIEHYNQLLELAKQLGYRQGEAAALGNLGVAYDALGEYHKAIEYHTNALKIDREIGSLQGQAEDLGNLGNAYQSLGEYDKAIEYHNQSLEIKRQLGDRQGEANALGNLGIAYQSLGEYHKAMEHYNQHLALARQLGDVAGQGNAWNNLGVALKDLKRYRDALACYFKALPIYERLGNPHNVETTRRNIAEIRAAVGEGDWAEVEAQARLLADDAAWLPGNDQPADMTSG